METVKEVSRRTGVSVRTLHYYDAIGLLRPTRVTEAGYRLYDERALGRLQSILLFRELQFSLKEIKEILDSPDFDPREALAQQIGLLELQYKRMGEVIAFAREIEKKGAIGMDFAVFDKSEMEQYREEAKAKWGGTKAYREYEEREKKGQDMGKTAPQLMELFARFGALKGLPPEGEAVQEIVAALQRFITENYYTCTCDILLSLGQMYTGDERFRKNIDEAGGPGTAGFAQQAIEVYCAEHAAKEQ